MSEILNNSNSIAAKRHRAAIRRAERVYFGANENNIGKFGHSDNYDSKPASRFLDSVLVATKDGTIHSYKEGPVIATYKKGANIGSIYSWVIDSKGRVWWQIDRTGPFANKFVLHEPGKFDGIILEETSSGLAIEKEKAKRDAENVNPVESILTGAGDVVSGVGKTLSGLGNNFGLITLIIFIAVIGIAFWQLNK